MVPDRSGSAFSSSRASQLVYVAKMVHVCMSLEWIYSHIVLAYIAQRGKNDGESYSDELAISKHTSLQASIQKVHMILHQLVHGAIWLARTVETAVFGL